MITEIILAIMALLFLMVGIFLFKGNAAWLIAGYNSLSEEEKKKYDKKTICKAASLICFVCCVILCVIAYIAHKANSDMIDETSMITVAVVLLAILIIAIITVGLYVTKRNKKMRGSNKMNQKYDAHSGLNYYEINNDRQPLVLIHAQGVDGTSYDNVSKRLSKKFHIYAIDCYGHGKSSHAPESYNIVDISNAVISFIENVVKSNVWLLGHSSGGLIAAFIASKTTLCDKLILEDPPFFSSQGDSRKNTFNYVDLSTICHNYIMQDEQKDFVLYYFTNQYAWNLFPEKSRNKVRAKLVKIATTYRKKHPDKDLKVLFWPKSALAGYKGMNNYDPLFGETFYNDSFHCGIPHEDILSKISCDTIFMKAKTNIGNNGLLLAALSDDDVRHVSEVIPKCKIVHFDCGHGIHIEKPKEFIRCLINLK